ncbi:NADH-cytochrome b5 reductase-like isoform X2 [Dasypus novemcinctus]|uniref:NADH-cytochrome b5 reductase-like isoform X2 n=1 Tax=Dasypus novemcinctus TaxID=9361 RepID=UPI000328B95C|nr:NADH-cytochrome b5 reductase-like isoform X2 [Dasypus novemcinctus]
MGERNEDDDEDSWLQLRPVEPLPSQCCGSGCSPCVFDIYHRDLARWEAARTSKDRSLLSEEESQSCPSGLSPDTFLAFSISAVERLTKDTYWVRFTLPGNSQLGLQPGQHLILRGTVDDLEIQRAYTPISPANAKGYFEVLIKCYQTGLMSRCVESWRAGDTAFWRGPFGGFLYKPNQFGELLMLAAGTGLAPMVSILQSITDNADDETFVTLVGCFKTFEGIYLKTFLQEQAGFWNVRTFFVLSQAWLPKPTAGACYWDAGGSTDWNEKTWSPGLALLLTWQVTWGSWCQNAKRAHIFGNSRAPGWVLYLPRR